MPERPRPGRDRITAGGVVIGDPKDQTVVKDDLRRHVETATDWEYRQPAAHLYRWAVVFKERLLDPVLLTDRRRMPDPVISFEKMRLETLAAYTLIRNPQGLLDEISFNTVHFIAADPAREGPAWRFGEWGLLETLLHEQVHLWQQNFGQHPIKPGRAYHNAEFVAKCESLGLHPRLVTGSHYKPADGAFETTMKEYGIERPPEIEASGRLDWWDLLLDLLGKEKKKGQSTLAKWSCGCQTARVGTKEFHAQCLRCGGLFVRVEGKAPQTAGQEQTLYDASEAEQRMSWADHEQGIYQPLIHSERIRELHRLVVLTGEPMTVLVDLALRQFCEKGVEGATPTSSDKNQAAGSDFGQSSDQTVMSDR